MKTRKQLIAEGLKLKRFRWKWLPARYELATSEFDDTGNFWSMDYKTYLTLWVIKLNKYHKREKYQVVKTKKMNEWYYTIYETTLGG